MKTQTQICTCGHKEEAHYRYLVIRKEDELNCGVKDCPCKKFQPRKELRTLKDLGFELSMVELSGNPVGKERIIYANVLKQEAIKWVKSLNENRIPDFYPMRGAFKDGALIFIKEFFNLTEEDLISIDVNEVIDLNSIKKRKRERKQK